MKILHEIKINNWFAQLTSDIQVSAVQALEEGKILYFSDLPFVLSPQEVPFLSAKFSNFKAKNISFNDATGALRGADFLENQQIQLKEMMQRFAKNAKGLVTHLFPAYASAIETGRTSFRPIEILGRKTSYRKDDTRLHVDAFPATPNQGKRILRIFTNINPNQQSRLWRVGDSFSNIANEFLPKISRHSKGKASLLKAFKITKSYRTEYDHMMLQIHDRMKADLRYQASSPQQEIHFPPGSTWIVQTDHVSHAAMAGQHVLEQTFYLPVEAMVNPSLSPLRVLERLAGKALV